MSFSRWLACFAVVLSCTDLGLAAGKRTTDAGGALWPQWRGPARDGISSESGLLARWPEGGPPLVWTGSGLGEGYSGVSVAGGKIFTMGDRDGSQWIIAVSATDGKEAWSAKVGPAWDESYSGSRCTPTIDGEFAYALGTHGDLVCVRLADGKPVWKRSLPNEFGGRVHSHWGFSESPLVDGPRLVCTPGGADTAMLALNKRTGKEIWRAAIPDLGPNGGDGAGYSSIVVSNAGNTRQYVQLMGRGVVGIAVRNGRFLWGYNKIANGTANIPTPLVHKDYVFCSTGYRTGAALLKLRGGGERIVADEVYFLDAKQLQNHHGQMVMVGDYIYCGHGHKAGAPTCLEWRTGKVQWRKDRGPGSGSAHVTYADGNVYFRYENGLMALVGASPKEYEEKGTFSVPDSGQPSWPAPVVAGGRLYLREQDKLYCYDLRNRVDQVSLEQGAKARGR